MEERKLNLKFDKKCIIVEEEVEECPKPSYEHCSNTVGMIMWISLILTIVTAGSWVMTIPLITTIISGSIYIVQMYYEPIKYWLKKYRKGR